MLSSIFLMYGVVGIFFLLIVFLLLRMVWLWYWKIDKIVDLLENIDNNTKNPIVVKSIKDKMSKTTIADAKELMMDGIACPKCNKNTSFSVKKRSLGGDQMVAEECGHLISIAKYNEISKGAE